LTDTFGSRLRLERLRRNLTQEQFGQLGGVSRVSQHLYEQGVRAPDVNYLIALSAHGVDAAVLLDPNRGSTADHTLAAEWAFAAVDELARDENGDALSLQERLTLFHRLVGVFLASDAPTNKKLVTTLATKKPRVR
jgi:transcriptional regulator with XRE-family HTH domain